MGGQVLATCQNLQRRSHGLQGARTVLDELDRFEEGHHAQSSRESGGPTGGQDMVGAGQVVPQGHRAVGPDEDGAGVADPTRDLWSIGRVDLQVLGRVGVGNLNGLREVTY